MRLRVAESIVRGKEKLAVSVDLPVSQPGKRALAYGAQEAERLNRSHIGTEHLLVGLFREGKIAGRPNHWPSRVSRWQDCGRKQRGQFLQRRTFHRYLDPTSAAPAPNGARNPRTRGSETRGVPQQFRNLTALAAEGRLGPLIGREREMERTIRILSRRYRKNPVLLGGPASGKQRSFKDWLSELQKTLCPPSWRKGRSWVSMPRL